MKHLRVLAIAVFTVTVSVSLVSAKEMRQRGLAILKERATCLVPVSVTVESHVEPTTLDADFSRRELAALAAQSGRSVAHIPLGFYRGQIAYSIKWQRGAPRTENCPSTIHVRASLSLVNRKIEIAQEIISDRCLYKNALLHYAKHAKADEIAFDQFVDAVEGELRKSASTSISKNAPQFSEGSDIEKSVRAILDKALRPLDGIRALSQNSVDTPQQVLLLDAPACGSRT